MKQFITIFSLLLIVFMSCQLEPEQMERETVNETVEPSTKCINIDHVVGGVWIAPKLSIKLAGKEFKTELLCNTGDSRVGAFSVQVSYNPQIVQPNLLIGDKGVDTDVFVLPYGGYAVNILSISETEEILFISGFHAFGVEPSGEAFLFDLNWIGQSTGITKITPNVLDLYSIMYDIVGTPTGYPGAACIIDLGL
ncbi:MAG: hypothetical protein JXJ04_20235 [Spirochaetales bacterium]|nr:hypothetical protein [Spirochaetales bacterium]